MIAKFAFAASIFVNKLEFRSYSNAKSYGNRRFELHVSGVVNECLLGRVGLFSDVPPFHPGSQNTLTRVWISTIAPSRTRIKNAALLMGKIKVIM